MNIKALWLDAILSSIEQDKAQNNIEQDLIDEIISSIELLRQSIQTSKEGFK